MSEPKDLKPISEFTEEQREWFRINKKYERKLQPFIGKSLLSGSPEYEKCKSIEQERELEFLKFNEKHCKPEPIDTTDKLSEWIDQELVTLDMIKMANRGEFPFERAKESYQKARGYALELRVNNPDLLSLPAPPRDTEFDSKIPFQSMKEWCIDTGTKRNADLAKLKPAETKQIDTPTTIININNLGVLGGIKQVETLQTGDNASTHKHIGNEEKKKGILSRIPYWIYLLVSFLAALFACIHYWPEIHQKLQSLFSH